jgi:arabinogalactan endo-1,4-beta-galactosidase
MKDSQFYSLIRKVAFFIVLIACMSVSCKKKSEVTPTPTPPVTSTGFVKGADVSWVTEMEASGKKFYAADGKETECMTLMKSLGMNTIRLRVWVNPSPAWNNTADVVAKAVRAKNLGLRVLIDFHYSDDWADPAKQTKPAAWSSLDLTGLKEALAKHTTDVLNELKKNEVTPEWVQVGNETNDGMLWPTGKASSSMANFAQMINAGYDAVKAVFPNAKVIVHVSNGYDNSLFRWMFDGLKNNGAKYDVIGMSLYPSYASKGWAAVNQDCLANMNDMVSRYGKEVMIVEVGMPWDSASECKSFISDLITKVKSVSDNKGLGVLYWEPQCYGGWKGYTLGAFDNNGKPTVAMSAFAD